MDLDTLASSQVIIVDRGLQVTNTPSEVCKNELSETETIRETQCPGVTHPWAGHPQLNVSKKCKITLSAFTTVTLLKSVSGSESTSQRLKQQLKIKEI